MPPSTSARSSRMIGGEVLVVGLLLEDHERADDVQPRLDHRRELAREDLQRLRLDLLERGARRLLAGRGQLVEPRREQAADAQLLARRRRIGCMHLAERLDADGVDRAVRVGRHTSTGIGRGIRPLEVRSRPADEPDVKDLRSEEGFGLIELLISMMMLNVGILAIVAAFNSGAIALRNASDVSTARCSATSRWSSTGRSSTPRSRSTRPRSGRRTATRPTSATSRTRSIRPAPAAARTSRRSR